MHLSCLSVINCCHIACFIGNVLFNISGLIYLVVFGAIAFINLGISCGIYCWLFSSFFNMMVMLVSMIVVVLVSMIVMMVVVVVIMVVVMVLLLHFVSLLSVLLFFDMGLVFHLLDTLLFFGLLVAQSFLLCLSSNPVLLLLLLAYTLCLSLSFNSLPLFLGNPQGFSFSLCLYP